MSDVTRILSQIEDGDQAAAKQLLPLVYEELRQLAADKLAETARREPRESWGSFKPDSKATAWRAL